MFNSILYLKSQGDFPLLSEGLWMIEYIFCHQSEVADEALNFDLTARQFLV